MVIGLARFHPGVVSHAVWAPCLSFVASLMSVSVFPSTMLESYAALLKSLQEVVHKKGFDLATPVVRSECEFGSCNLCVLFLQGPGFLPREGAET